MLGRLKTALSPRTAAKPSTPQTSAQSAPVALVPPLATPSPTAIPEPAEPPPALPDFLVPRNGLPLEFNLRTRHRSLLSHAPARNDVERKLAFFLIVGPNNAQTRRYRAWIDEYALMTGGNTRPPVPEDFRTFLGAQGLSII